MRRESLLARRPLWLAPLFVGVFAGAGLLISEILFRAANAAQLPDGYRLQDWSSNWTMQNLGLEEMWAFGAKSLWYDHVYPPLADSIRFALMLPETLKGLAPDPFAVDLRLYSVYAVLFGVTTSIVYLWVRDLTRNGWLAGAAAAVWAISPGFITVMTLLEPTPPALTFITISFYLLYRFLKTRRLGYATGFFGALLIASLTRNVMQIHVLLIVVIALVAFWLIARKRTWLTMTMNVVLVALIFFLPLKQYVLFGSLDVSTHTGFNRSGALWIDPRTVPDPEYPANLEANALVFASRYNTQEIAKGNYRLGAAANELMLSQPLEAARRLWKSAQVTIPEVMKPTSKSTQNYFVERIPWRLPFDFVFSSWIALILIGVSFAVIIWRRTVRGAGHLLRKYGWLVVFWLLIAIPVLFSNRYWPGQEDEGAVATEASRLKTFLEIPVFVLVVYTGWLLGSGWWAQRKTSGRGVARTDVF